MNKIHPLLAGIYEYVPLKTWMYLYHANGFNVGLDNFKWVHVLVYRCIAACQ